MIVSHRWRFIFIKTRKTGGTSLEIALSTLCGPDDVITSIRPPDEAIRASLGGRPPQNCGIDGSHWSLKQRLSRMLGGEPPRFHSHMTAVEMKRLLGPEVWRDYYKFTIERNPFDKVVSAYYWRWPQEPRPTLSRFIRSRRIKRFRNAPLYQTASGELLVDHVVRYEDLAAEVEAIRQRIGLPALPVLPRAKGNFRSDRRPPSEILSAADRARVSALFHDEIERFGYRCG